MAAVPSASALPTIVAVVAAMSAMVTATPITIIPRIVSSRIVTVARIITRVIIISGRRWGWGWRKKADRDLCLGLAGKGKGYYSDC